MHKLQSFLPLIIVSCVQKGRVPIGHLMSLLKLISFSDFFYWNQIWQKLLRIDLCNKIEIFLSLSMKSQQIESDNIRVQNANTNSIVYDPPKRKYAFRDALAFRQIFVVVCKVDPVLIIILDNSKSSVSQPFMYWFNLRDNMLLPPFRKKVPLQEKTICSLIEHF